MEPIAFAAIDGRVICFQYPRSGRDGWNLHLRAQWHKRKAFQYPRSGRDGWNRPPPPLMFCPHVFQYPRSGRDGWNGWAWCCNGAPLSSFSTLVRVVMVGTRILASASTIVLYFQYPRSGRDGWNGYQIVSSTGTYNFQYPRSGRDGWNDGMQAQLILPI